jgi:tripartite-type tricarboxylate transporter receptor subunit TctC
MQSRIVCLAALALWMCSIAPAGAAENFPARPIRFIVPAPPGGITDIPARVIAERMREHLNHQTLVVDNRSGAGGIVGAEIAKQARPDGYTLFYAHAAVLAFLPALMPKLPYRILEDFDPVIHTVRSPMACVVRADGPFRSVQGMIDAAKNRAQGLNYGTAGAGNASHLLGLMLGKDAKISLTPIHHRGDSPAVQDLLAGQIDFFTAGAIKPQVDSGRLRVLATTGAQRWFVFPDAPTFQELGFPGVELYGFSGIMAPKGTPAMVVQHVNRAANEALKDATVRERLMGIGFEIIGGGPEDMRKFLVREIDRYKRIGAENNLVIE